jgi:outer membrane protein assembly factor BamD
MIGLGKRIDWPAPARLSRLALCAVFAAVLLGGCGGSLFGKKKEEAVSTDPPDTLYQGADQLLDRGRFGDAATKFEQVDRDHPYSPEARRAIVMAAYAYYRQSKYEEAISASQRYLTLHPGTSEADLAQNVLAMSYYDQITGPQRDQSNARRALDAYDTLIRRYPDSRYAAEASNRARILRDLLAAGEMTVGRYYLNRHNYLAAINRFRTVVTEYQTTPQVEEALMRLTECYLALGIVNEAQTAAAVLGHNFPDGQWYKHAYSQLQKVGVQPERHEGSWITRTWRAGDPA